MGRLKRTTFRVPREVAYQQDVEIKAEGVISSSKEYLIGESPEFYDGMSNEDASLAVCDRAIRKWANQEYSSNAGIIFDNIREWVFTRDEITKRFREKSNG